MNKITYHQEGDYLIPDIIIGETTKNQNLGKFGHLRLNYIKEFKKGLYISLKIKGTLSNYLKDIDTESNNRLENIINDLAKEENITEELKQSDPLNWVQSMNNIKNKAEEIVLNEFIYV